MSLTPEELSATDAVNKEITRRHLIKIGATGIAAAATAKIATAQTIGSEPVKATGQPFPKITDPLPQPEDKRVGFAIVGLGKFAMNQIIPSIGASKKCKLVALVSGDEAKAKRVARDYGVSQNAIYNYQTFAQIKNNPEVQVVYIITPNAFHRAHVETAARAGKHVLCEKPLSTNAADASAMIAACRAAGVKLMTAYRAQYEPFNLEAIRLCRSGQFGKMTMIISDHCRSIDVSDPADQWRLDKQIAGGGPLPDIGIYSLNACRYLTGAEPTEVQAMLHKPTNDPRFREVEQSVVWSMRFPNGVIASCTTAYGQQEVKRYRVFFEKGWLDLDPATDYYKHNMTIERAFGPIGTEPQDTVEYKNIREERPIAEKNQFALMMDHMADCVLQNKTPKTPGEEGLRDVQIIEAIYEAARTGQIKRL